MHLFLALYLEYERLDDFSGRCDRGMQALTELAKMVQ
jgi:hypothetical protein